MYITVAVVSGGLIALMILVNGGLQGSVGALPALVFIHSMGFLASAGSLAVGRRFRRFTPPFALPGPSRAPLWFAAAGTLGIGVVFINNLIFAKGGVLLALGGTLAGQTLVADILEGTRWFDGRKSPVVQRVLSLVLVLPGAAIIGFRSGLGPGWVALSWLPGAILMVQSMMNSRNALRWGTSKMLLFNYATALSVLIPLFALFGGEALSRPEAVGLASVGGLHALLHLATTVPVYLTIPGGVIGVIVVGTTSYLFNRSSAVKVVLGLYVGQIGVGIAIDTLSGLPFQMEKIGGVVMVLLGLGAGELHRFGALKRRRE